MIKNIILLFLILSLTTIVSGANEIRSFDAGATTCFAVIREIDGKINEVQTKIDHLNIDLTEVQKEKEEWQNKLNVIMT